MPDVSEVPGQASGHEEQGVDADVVAGPREAGGQPLGGDGDPAQPVMVERHRRTVGVGARLDLDEGKHAATPGDEVDLAARHPRAAGEDPPAVQPQPPGGERLGGAAALLGDGAAVQRDSSSARA